MAKLQDKFFNRVIEGELVLDAPVKGDLELESGGKAKIFENIVDKDGHARFIEGDIVLTPQVPSTFAKVFGKWSLSGSHLMLVFIMTMPNGGVLPEFTVFANTSEKMPKWNYDKIYALFGSQNNIIAEEIFRAFANNGLTQNLGVRLIKTNDYLQLQNTSSLTLDSDKTIRIAFDLLIDNE